VPPALAQREIALAAVALLAAILGLAIASARGDQTSGDSLPARVGPWRDARAAPLSTDLVGTTSACGVRLRAKTMGLADPVLPCGAKLYIGFGDEEVLTQVVATGPEVGGVRFGITPALAQSLGIEGRVTVRWSYAR
jgi:hypothetical protein